MNPRRFLPLLAALVLLALGAVWVLTRGRAAQPELRPAPRAVQDAAGRQAPSFHGEASSVREPVDAPRPAQEGTPASVEELAPPPEEWVLEDESDRPPDPVESGPASLFLRLIDAHSGDAIASRLELWRIEAPGNADWSAGDQLQLTADVPAEGARFPSLPEGRYRASCARADGGSVLPEFEVRAPHTEVELALELPGDFEVRVHFLDRFGVPYPSAHWWPIRMRLVDPPTAVRSPREQRGASGSSWSHSMAVSFAGQASMQEVVQTAEGLLLGRFSTASRECGFVPVMRLRAPDGALAEIEVPAQADGDLLFVAVGLSPDVAAARVRLPDGRASAAQVEALGLGLPCEDPGRAWRSAPVHLRADLAGFASVDLQWRAADGELPWILLEPLD